MVIYLAIPIRAGVTAGGELGFGKEISGIGAAITMGTQSYLDKDSTAVVRTLFSKINFGPENIDNVGAVLVNYFLNIKDWGFKIGSRVAADYEIAESNIGLAAGIEACQNIGYGFSLYGHGDLVKRDVVSYFVVGIGVILQ
jgi:hypothetical protein